MIETESCNLQTDLFCGKFVKLVTEEAQTVAKHFSRWARDTEYWRLANSNPVRPLSVKAVQGWVEKELAENGDELFEFSIRTTADDRLIGDVGLDGVCWNHGESFVGIGIGEREFWGKGYGTEAMQLILRYAFSELNLQRVSLNVFSYNSRAIRSYEKAGFMHEGRARNVLQRDGQRYDLVFMGILREEWVARYHGDGTHLGD